MVAMSFHPEDLIGVVNPIVVALFVPLVVIIALLIVRIYLWRKKYICTECNQTFHPKFLQVHMGWHDGSRGRDQYCPHCKKISFCKYDQE